MISLLRPIIKQGLKPRLNKIDAYEKLPQAIQDEMFFALIEQAKSTEWGRTYAYSEIKDIPTFQERVPVSTYEDLEPYINRMRQGEADMLWPGEVEWFAKSSGTTGSKSKFIPVTKDILWETHYKGGEDTTALYLRQFPDSDIFSGKTLILGGSLSENPMGISEGDISAVMIKNIPFALDLLRAPDRETALMKEWEAKLQAIVEETIDVNITSLSGAPAWFLTLIKKVLEVSGKKHLLEVWPELELFVHGGISFEPYREEYKMHIPSSEMRYMEVYNASEGFFGIQSDLNDPSLLLMLDYNIFYEFMPLEEIGKKFPKTYTIEEVELDKNYAMIISTCGGLWRYLIGDTVMFSSKYPYKFRITGRTKYFINAFGEELIADNAEKALSKACKKTGATVHEYTVAPVFMEGQKKGAHQWLIEFSKAPHNMEEFAEILDLALQNENSDYEAKRYKDLTMQRLDLKVIPKGGFYKWLKHRGKLGGQNKVPRLQNDRKIADEIISLIFK